MTHIPRSHPKCAEHDYTHQYGCSRNDRLHSQCLLTHLRYHLLVSYNHYLKCKTPMLVPFRNKSAGRRFQIFSHKKFVIGNWQGPNYTSYHDKFVLFRATLINQAWLSSSLSTCSQNNKATRLFSKNNEQGTNTRRNCNTRMLYITRQTKLPRKQTVLIKIDIYWIVNDRDITLIINYSKNFSM